MQIHTDAQQVASIAMFTRAESYLSTPGWRGSSVRFMFRTTTATAILLYQPGAQSGKGVQLMVMLQDGKNPAVFEGQDSCVEVGVSFIQLQNRK